MELYHDSAGPRIDRSVAARLKRLDRDLAVTFSRFAIDPFTSLPLEIRNWDGETEHLIHRRGGSAFLYEPCFFLWLRDGSRWRQIGQYRVEQGFGHREVAALEADAARHMSPADILARIRDVQETRKRRRQANALELRRDVAKANMSRIQRLAHDHDKSHDPTNRQAKATSYAGQGNRGTRGEVRKDNREDGWELPTKGDY